MIIKEWGFGSNIESVSIKHNVSPQPQHPAPQASTSTAHYQQTTINRGFLHLCKRCKHMELEIKPYEEWMREQVVALFDAEYQTGANTFSSLFDNFYEHPFQNDHCIRIVSTSGDTVAGFQSFFYWPLMYKGQVIRAFQSGNSLVHPDFRGKGLFGKLLNYIHLPENNFDFDLLIGFPVPMSYGSFMRKDWKNPFNLQWYVKPLNPITAVFSSPESELRKAWSERKKLNFTGPKEVNYIAQQSDFDDYRFSFEEGSYYRFTYESGEEKSFFELKAQTRKKFIRELMIGKFLCSNLNPEFVSEAFKALVKSVRQSASFSMLSIAVNPGNTFLVKTLDQNGFRPINRSIHFIAKGPIADEITDWSDWWVFRGDIDTW